MDTEFASVALTAGLPARKAQWRLIEVSDLATICLVMRRVVEPPDDVLDAIFSGLKVSRSWLGGAVAVPVARRRRDRRGWPALVVAARIDGPRFKSEIGLWATDERGARLAPIGDVARSWSLWRGDSGMVDGPEASEACLARFPECDRARRALEVSDHDRRPPPPHRH
jgi:hypothetical protein